MAGILTVEFFEILPVQREQHPTFPRSVCQHLLVGHGKPVFACIAVVCTSWPRVRKATTTGRGKFSLL
jgi:hypothetical protein